MKKYLGKTASEWYQTNLLKDEEYKWENWKAVFLKAFSNKGWSAVQYTYNFKYISGSFTKYAIKQDRLILEVRRKTSDETRINVIVIRLPIHIQDKVYKEAVQSTGDLIGLLLQYKDHRKGRKSQESNARLNRMPEPPRKDLPCVLCEALNFPGQCYPIQVCRNRNRNAQRNQNQVNSLEAFITESNECNNTR